MNAVAVQNARVRNPVYHLVLSWPAGERPTDDQAFACGAHSLAAIGLTGHQYVFGVHRDTSHVHLHIAVNRVHPTTLKAVYPKRDFFKLDRAMRELELRYGWRHDRGPYAVFNRNGVMVVDWSSKSPESKGKVPTAARDMERHADQESFFSYVRGAPRAAVVAALKGKNLNWQELHQVLGRDGLELREKGQGFAIYDRSSSATTPVKASDMHEELSKARLVRRLGPFVAAADEPTSAETVYDKHRPPKRDPEKREERREERAAARRALRARYEDYCNRFVYRRLDQEEVRDRYVALRRNAFARREEVRNTISDKAARKAMYSVIAFETLRARYRLRQQIRDERSALRSDPSNKRLSYRQWIEREAAGGDSAAISQLRGYAYQEQRRRGTGASSNGIVLDGDLDPVVNDVAGGMKYIVRRDGSVLYRNDGGRDGFVDYGDRIDVLVNAKDHPATVETALRLAADRSGNSFNLVGTKPFTDEAVEILVRERIPVRLRDAGLEAQRQALAANERSKGVSRPVAPGG